MSEKNKFYVTTPIYYVNAKPHIGSLYSTLLADVAARYNKLQNKKVFFLTGTDEHGQKIAQAAHAAGKQPKEFVDSFIAPFQDVWKLYAIEYTKFIRTTDADHTRAVQAWLQALIAQGDIYKSHYAGYYCTPCEAFVTEKDLLDEPLGSVPLCPTCGRVTEYVSEESYFFKLSSYQERLLQFYKDNPDFITPKERFAEVITFVQSGLKDLSISRTTITWGIPFPGDDKHVTYVWADALNNYITGIGYGVPRKEQEFNFWWPADLQVLGKDIVRFHAVYWPAFLMASGLQMPKKLLVHGWIKIGEQKMSKSLGNAIDPVELATTYGVDQVRYYLVRHLAITQDSPFTYQELEQRINADLAHDLGNLLNRTITLALKSNLAHVSCPQTWATESVALHEFEKNCIVNFMHEMNAGYMSRAYAHVWEYIHAVNKYFNDQQPWKLAHPGPVISATCHALYAIAHVCWPLMPHKMERLLSMLGKKIEHEKDIFAQLLMRPWHESFTLTQGTILFNKIEPKPDTERASMTEEVRQNPSVSIDEFAKIGLRVGTIEDVQVLEKSDKLYVLKVDFGGHGIRQVLSGIRKYFTPEQLLKRQAVFVFNLAPRTMMGLDSQGMLLTARDAQENLVLIAPEHAVPNGTQLT